MAKLYTAGKVKLPFTYYGIIVGTYSDTTTRIINITVGIPDGKEKLTPFPNQPGGFIFYDNSDGDSPTTYSSTKSAEKDPDNSSQMILSVDRGFMYELLDLPQPEDYDTPLTGGKVGICDGTAAGLEVNEWCAAVHDIVQKLAKGDGIIPAKLSAFAVTQTSPASMNVVVGTGVAAVDDGLVYQEVAESVLISPTWITPTQNGWVNIARVYIDPLNGEIGVVYGRAVHDTPVAPSYPIDAINLAQIALTQGATPTIVTGNISTERVLS